MVHTHVYGMYVDVMHETDVLVRNPIYYRMFIAEISHRNDISDGQVVLLWWFYTADVLEDELRKSIYMLCSEFTPFSTFT